MKETLRSEWVKCGKPGCGSCPHGPYWYAYWKEGGKTRKRYIGRDIPKKEEKATPKTPQRNYRDDILNDRTANLALAWELLGVAHNSSCDACKAAYRKLAKELHPDKGGDEREFMRVQAAWSYLRARHGWR